MRAKGEGTIYQREDGRYEAKVTLGYRGGKRVRRSFYGDTQREVVEKLAKARREIQQGMPLPSGTLTLGRYLADWLEQTVKPSVRPSTFAGYSVNVRVHITPALGHLRLVKLAPRDVQQFIRAKLAEGLAPRTVQYLHATLRKALADATATELVVRNVAQLVPGPSVQRRPVTPLTPPQVRTFLDGIRGERFEAL